MSRINQISPETANGKAKELLEAVKSKLGLVPNLTRALANAPAALDAYLQFSGSLGKGSLSAKNRERIALVVAQQNHCDYCLAAHSTIGKMVGLSADEVRDSRNGRSTDSKSEVLIQFAQKVLETKGRVSDSDLESMRAAGFDDGTLAEVVGNVALNIFTNYFNHVAQTDVDFPAAEVLA